MKTNPFYKTKSRLILAIDINNSDIFPISLIEIPKGMGTPMRTEPFLVTTTDGEMRPLYVRYMIGVISVSEDVMNTLKAENRINGIFVSKIKTCDSKCFNLPETHLQNVVKSIEKRLIDLPKNIYESGLISEHIENLKKKCSYVAKTDSVLTFLQFVSILKYK